MNPPRLLNFISRFCTYACILALLAAHVAKATAADLTDTGDKPQVQEFPALNSPAAWTVQGNPAAELLAWDKCVGIQLDLTKAESTRLLLKEPVQLPEWATDLKLTLGALGNVTQAFLVRVVIRDARGKEYAYKVFSPHIRGKENYIFAQHNKGLPYRLTLPGLSRPVVAPAVGENIDLLVAAPAAMPGKVDRSVPEKPLQFVGLDLTTVRAGNAPIFIGNFQATRLTPRNSALYYVVNKDEGFVETDGQPSLPLALFGPANGEDFRLVWSIRDRFDGQPFLSDEKTYHFDKKDPAYLLNLNQRIHFPVAEKGTYWIQIRRLWNSARKSATDLPERIDEWDYRLDVLKGAPSIVRTPLAQDKALAGSHIRIAPDRESLIFGPEEAKALRVDFTPSATLSAQGTTGALTWRFQATRPASGQIAATREGPLKGTNAEPVTMPLDTLSPGAYVLRVELLQDGKPVDWSERLIGIKPAPGDGETQPDKTADWKKLTDGKSLIYIGMNKGSLKTGAERIAKVKTLLDDAKASNISNLVEYETNWEYLEPMPGVYDWSEMDEIIAYSKSKGMTVLVWPTFIGGEPDWIPAHFQEKQNGSITGTKAYLFQGGRINYWHSPDLKARILALSEAMAKRYRGNPAVHGYYLLVEHGGDNPWSGYFPGYEAETIADFRSYCREKWMTLDALNQRWATQKQQPGEQLQPKLTAWEQITVPGPDASDRRRLDWLVFRKERMTGFFTEAVRKIREADPYKLMMVYTGAVDVKAAPEYVRLGCMMADGGAAVPETGGSRTMGMAQRGLGRRTEEVSVGRWSGDFDTQLDATLFNLTLGGGKNAHCKMFFSPGRPLADLRKAPFSLDRFELFIPIWRELAATETMPRQTYMLQDRNAGMINGAASSTNVRADVWADMACFDAHLPSPAVPMDIAKTGKVIFLPGKTSYEKPIVDEMAAYVKGGGNLVMYADTGSTSPDLPGEEWVLLKALGITPPAVEMRPGILDVLPTDRTIFPETATTFKARDIWTFPEPTAQQKENSSPAATVLATFQPPATGTSQLTGKPALTRHAVGKGAVYVLWASAHMPSTVGGGYPFLRDIARAAGVETYSDSDIPYLWTNLLKNTTNSGNGSYYGTVYHAAWANKDRAAASGTTLWKVPSGTYEITELISGKSLGRKTAEELAKTGVPTTLGPRAVAVYRFAKQ